MMLLEIISIWW